MKMSGIYLIECVGRRYIGQSSNIDRRWREHRSTLKYGRHENSYLQRMWNKYGEDNFSFSVLELVDDPEYRNKREEYWITRFNTYSPNGMNLKEASEGTRHSKETRLKISLSRLGIVFSSEHKERISKALTGKRGFKHSEETKLKIGLGHKGKKYTGVQLENMQKASAKRKGKPGHPSSKETNIKISLAKKGVSTKGHKLSEETKRKIGESNRKRWELREKRTHSEETKLKMSISGKNRTDRKKRKDE